MLAIALGTLVCFVSSTATHTAALQKPDQAWRTKSALRVDDRALSAALCPIVYQTDRFPSTHGYRYIFYGNAFFINKDGYLLTAAHVLSQLHGGQPYLLLRVPASPPRFVQAVVVALDRDHDVAILRATPNPFGRDYTVSFLPLSQEGPLRGRTVFAAAIRPIKPRDAYTMDPALEERSAGEVLGFKFSQLEKGCADTELFLFGHDVQFGQSGGPVISVDSKEVVGIVEGQWLRTNITATPASTDHPGAVIPVHYAIALLQQKGIPWRTPERSNSSEQASGNAEGFSPPRPLSLVPAPYPSQSFFGGEVLLDALVGRTGTISSIRVVRGEQPFLEEALAAVRTWTFLPARSAGNPVESHIAIEFQFAQPYVPPRSPTVHHYDGGSSAGSDRVALPLTTVEPEYPPANTDEGSVILYESIDRQGHLVSVKVVRDFGPLTAATLTAAHQWLFAPAKLSGASVDSAAVIVFTFRRPLVTTHAAQ